MTAPPDRPGPARLDLPFVGIPTFMKKPHRPDWTAIDADIAVMGAPFDLGTQVRPGARFGPKGFRDASQLFAIGRGAYDPEDDIVHLAGDEVRIVDIGDADMVHIDAERCLDNIEYGVRKILAAGALPVVLGGDHAVHIPCIRAFDGEPPVHIVHIDAHLDYVDERFGVRHGQGNPLRRAAECDHVTGITHLGIRNLGSSAQSDFADARAAKSDILSVRDFRELGVAGVIERIPANARLYFTIDVDGFDPSLVPGTGTPSPGGFLYYETCDFLKAAAMRGEVVGVDFVELAPEYDPGGATSLFCTQILVNFLGYIFHAKKIRAGAAPGNGWPALRGVGQ